MIDIATLRRLADLGGPERAFLTLYLDDRDDLSDVEPDLERIRILLADQPVETEHFDESLAIARSLVSDANAPAGGAVAIYASWAAGLADVYTLPVAVGTMAWMGDAPYLRPAYELLDEHEPYAVAVIDNTDARVYLVRADDVYEGGAVRGDIKNSVKKGGWSQKRYARRRDKQIEAYATEVADGLAELADQNSFDRLVLVGSAEPIRAVTDALRTDLADRLVGTDSLDGNASEAEALELAADLAQDGEREAERDLWEQIREQGMGPGLAAFGATSIVDALRTHRVEALLIDREAEFAGTKCRACETVAHGTPSHCGLCGSSDVFRLDLVESMTEQATRTGAEVDFADPFPALTEVGGVAALLRYALEDNYPELEEIRRREEAIATETDYATPASDTDAAEPSSDAEPTDADDSLDAAEPMDDVEPDLETTGDAEPSRRSQDDSLSATDVPALTPSAPQDTTPPVAVPDLPVDPPPVAEPTQTAPPISQAPAVVPEKAAPDVVVPEPSVQKAAPEVAARQASAPAPRQGASPGRLALIGLAIGLVILLLLWLV